MMMKKLLLVTFTLLAGFTCSFPTLATDKAILVLDGSGSMWGQIDSKPKIQIAQKVIAELLDGWSPNVELGVIAYGHREKGNCSDIETLVAIGLVDAAAINATISNLNPKGKTPLTDAVRLAAKELRSEEEKATIILVSDGLETCEADPCAVSSELEAAGIDFTVHVIGFGTTPEENQQLQCLADNTGGQFLGANNAMELQEAMAETVELVAKPKPVEPIELVIKGKPEPAKTKTTVVKVSSQTGVIKYTDVKGTSRIYDANGTEVSSILASIPGFSTVQIAPGNYTIKGEGFELKDITIKVGQTFIVDANALVGWIKYTDVKGVASVYDANGTKVASTLASIPGFSTVQIAPGNYTIKGESFELKDITIEVGQTFIVDANALLGWIKYTDVKGTASVYDANGTKVASTPQGFSSVQIVPGNYTIKGEGFELKDVTIEVGQTFIVDANALVGWIKFTNIKGTERVYDANGTEVVSTYPGFSAVQIAPGNYTFKGEGFELKDITIKAGQTFVVDGRQ